MIDLFPFFLQKLMKTYIPLFLVLLLLCSPVFAKSGSEIATQVATLLNEQTACVIHIDLTQIDLKTACEEAVGQLEPFLAAINLDEKSIQGIAREAKRILRKGEKKIQDSLDTLVSQCGVSDVYFLGWNEPSLEFFAVPLANRAVAEREALVSFLREIPFLEGAYLEYGSGVQERNGFQVFGAFSPERFQEFPDEGDAKVKTILEDALKQATGTTLQVVVFLQTVKFFDQPLHPKSEIELQWSELADSMQKKLQSAVLTFDISQMKGTLILQANSESDAIDFEQDYRRGIELVGELVRESIQKDRDMAFLAPLVAEFLKGALKTVELQRNGNRFIMQYEDKMMFSTLINGAVGTAHFVFPSP